MNKIFLGKLPTTPLRISHEECHIWQIDLPCIYKENCLINLISKEEQKRLNAFKFLKDRFCYGITHAMKRCILASYLNELPEKLVFTQGEYGKPEISPQQNCLNLQFNLSHSHQRILFAITIEDPVGIDVEYHSDSMDSISMESLDKIIFSPLERQFFSKLTSEQEKTKIFFHLWTQKEAYLKAKGKGLTVVDFPSISADVSEKQPANKWLKILTTNEQEKLWNLLPLNIGEFYSASLVVANYKKRLSNYKINNLKNFLNN